MKKGNRSCPKFLLSTDLAILGIQRIIAVLKTILKHLSRSMRSALKDSMAFPGLCEKSDLPLSLNAEKTHH